MTTLLEMAERHIKALHESEELTLLKVQVSDLLDAIQDGGDKKQLLTNLLEITTSNGIIQNRIDFIRLILETL